jgi:hypothetical protein
VATVLPPTERIGLGHGNDLWGPFRELLACWPNRSFTVLVAIAGQCGNEFVTSVWRNPSADAVLAVWFFGIVNGGRLTEASSKAQLVSTPIFLVREMVRFVRFADFLRSNLVGLGQVAPAAK